MDVIEESPEEFAADVEETFWAAVTPADRRVLDRLYRKGGKDGIRQIVDGQIRDDIENRSAYVDAMVDTIASEIGD